MGSVHRKWRNVKNKTVQIVEISAKGIELKKNIQTCTYTCNEADIIRQEVQRNGTGSKAENIKRKWIAYRGVSQMFGYGNSYQKYQCGRAG